MLKKMLGSGARRTSVSEANQGFLELIARVERGERFIVTKNNRPVARIELAGLKEATNSARRPAAIERLDLLMKSGRRSKDGWTFAGRKSELHDRSGG